MFRRRHTATQLPPTPPAPATCAQTHVRISGLGKLKGTFTFIFRVSGGAPADRGFLGAGPLPLPPPPPPPPVGGPRFEEDADIFIRVNSKAESKASNLSTNPYVSLFVSTFATLC